MKVHLTVWSRSFGGDEEQLPSAEVTVISGRDDGVHGDLETNVRIIQPKRWRVGSLQRREKVTLAGDRVAEAEQHRWLGAVKGAGNKLHQNDPMVCFQALGIVEGAIMVRDEGCEGTFCGANQWRQWR